MSALGFYQSVSRTTPSPENFYLGIGKQTDWDSNGDLTPETPLNNIAYEEEVKQNLIGLKKITASNLAFVVPRYNWSVGQVYSQYSPNDSELFVPPPSTSFLTKRFYVMTSDFNVYKCLNNNTNQPSLVPPTGTSTSPILTGDGYTWKFMYNLSSSMITQFLLTDWLPVPYGSQKTAFQLAVENSATYAPGSTPSGHGFSAIHELGANRVLLAQKFEQDELGILPVDTEFRQVSMIANPRLISTGLPAQGSVYNILDSNNDIDLTSGNLMFLDNREVINRSIDQTETIRLIVGF